MKILIIQQKRIGDVLVSTTVCSNLRNHYPTAEIHYLVYSFTNAVVQGNPDIDEILLFEDSDRSPFRLFKFALNIRKRRYDIVIDLYSKGESLFFTLLSGAKQRISYKHRFGLYNHASPPKPHLPKGVGRIMDHKLRLLTPLLGEHYLYDIQPRIHLTSVDLDHGKKILSNLKIDPDKPIAMFGIYGSVDNKTYPPAYMQSIVDGFRQNYRHQIILVHFADQTASAQHFLGQLRDAESLVVPIGKPSLRHLITCISLASVYIGNDCGYAHIAKALSVPTFTIFSPSIPKTDWGILEHLPLNESVDIGDFFPGEIKDKSLAERDADSERLYTLMSPALVANAIQNWITKLTADAAPPHTKSQTDV